MVACSRLVSQPACPLMLLPPQSQIEVSLGLATTNPVPPYLRGKLNGLYYTCYYAGGMSPSLWAVGFAWSISSGKTVPLVDHCFVFVLLAALLMVVNLLGLKVFTVESLTRVAKDPPDTSLSLEGMDISTSRTYVASPRYSPVHDVPCDPRRHLV